MNRYEASWGKALVVVSIFASLICIGVGITVSLNVTGPIRWAGLLSFAIPSVCALFTIRGYFLSMDAILIERLFWTTRLPLDGLQSVKFEPNAMRNSLRTFGNGGLFSFSGFFWNKPLGAYRAYVTNLQKTVVLRFGKKTVVLSPSEPELFVREVVNAHARHGITAPAF